MDTTVSVLILNFRNPQATVRCVQALQKQTIADTLEMIVIDNHSEDDSIGVLRNRIGHMPNVRLVETDVNRGFGAGYNFGARFATGEFLLMNNPDKVLQEDGVERLLRKMQGDESIGILAPVLLHADGTRRLSIRAEPRPLDVLSRRSFLGSLWKKRLSRYLMLDADPAKEQDVDWVVGGCFLIRRSFYEELSGFDERFFLFFEDTDLCRRVRRAGKHIIYFPDVKAFDRKRRLSGERLSDLFLSKTGRTHVRSALRYFRKWGSQA